MSETGLPEKARLEQEPESRGTGIRSPITENFILFFLSAQVFDEGSCYKKTYAAPRVLYKPSAGGEIVGSVRFDRRSRSSHGAAAAAVAAAAARAAQVDLERG